MVTRHPDLAERISNSGIVVTGHCGDFTIPVPSVATPEELEGIFDYVLIATKAGSLVEAARRILPFLNENSRVVSMQNGICEEMLAIKRVRNLFIEVIREAIEVAGAMDLTVVPAAAGKLDFYTFLGPGFLSGMKRHITIRVIGMKYRKLKSSSLQSLERGRKTEVEFFNGYISAKAREFNVATPINDQLTSMVREIEEGKRAITPNNFREITF